jgi:hypothetical protein
VARQKQAGNALQNREMAFGRIAFERDFEFVDDLQGLRQIRSLFSGNSSRRISRAIDWSYVKRNP